MPAARPSRNTRGPGAALTLVALALAPGALPARAETGLRTGATHVVAVTSAPTAGLEAGMPRTGAYARGIDLDVRGRWGDSETAYREAAEEFRRLLKRRPQWDKAVRGWIEKAEFQREQSRVLNRQNTYYPSYRGSSHYYVTAHSLYYRATAKHNKWLGIRAFSGRGPRQLAESAIADYRKALSHHADYTLARLGLAGLLHEIGRHDRGRAEFQKIVQPPSKWMYANVAYYHLAAGNTERALDHLEEAVRYSSSVRRHLHRSNDFDRLRAHPRFRRLMGPKP